MKICPKCGNSHDKSGKFCSRSCANSRTWTVEINEKRSKSSKNSAFKRNPESVSESIKTGHRYQGPYCKIKWLRCTNCNKEFWASPQKPQYTTCSDACFLSIKRKNRAGNKVQFNNEWYDSGWEVKMVKWLNSQRVEYTRKIPGILWIDKNGKHHRYFPDFYIPSLDLYVDPKNKFCVNDQKEKLDYVKSRINLIYGELHTIQKFILELINEKKL